MFRTEINVQTGEVAIIQLTPIEIAAALECTAIEAAKPLPKSLAIQMVETILANPEAIALLKIEMMK